MYETYYNLGIAATSAKKYDIAIEAFQNGIKIKPNHVDFYYSLAIAQSEYADDILNKETDEELTEEEKNKISHRGKAVKEVMAAFKQFNLF
jgi:cytochrome c-type biogenesis protein CcmH/NrfG